MNPPNGITILPNGQWVITEDTHLSNWAIQKGNIITDPHLFHWLKPHLEKVRVVWDIGANIGDHTRQYLDWGKTVVAVEPNPLAFACLTQNCPEAICLNAAASDSAGEPLGFQRLPNAGASRIHPDGDILVYPVVLDDENLPVPGAVKVDVEGFEMSVLRGMEETIVVDRPLVFMEINHGALAGNGVRADDIVEWMNARGYVTHSFYPPQAQWSDPQFDCLFVPKA